MTPSDTEPEEPGVVPIDQGPEYLDAEHLESEQNEPLEPR